MGGVLFREGENQQCSQCGKLVKTRKMKRHFWMVHKLILRGR